MYSLIIALHCETTNITENIEGTKTTEDQYISINTETTQHIFENESVNTTASATQVYEDEQVKPTREATEQIITTCLANGKFYMTENMTIIFEANPKTLKITAKGEDFHIFCNTNEAIWSSTIQSIAIYGLDENENNYDDFRLVSTTINLCQLQTNSEINFNFVD